jgi:phage baseplate assembly protein gpV
MTAWPFGCDCPISIFRGTVEKVDPEKAKARVNIPELKGPDNKPFVTDPLPVVQPWTHGARFFSLPQVGAQAYVVFLDKGHMDGFVLGSRYSDNDPAPSNRRAEELFTRLGDKNGTFVSVAPASRPDHDEIRVETMGGARIHGGERLQVAANEILNFFGRIATLTAWIRLHLIARVLAVNAADKVEADCGSITVKAKKGVKVQAGGSITIKAENGVLIQSNQPITVKGPDVSIEADSVTVKAKTIAVDATASLTVTSPAVTINGALTVTGALSAASVAAGGASISASGAMSAASVTASGQVTAADFASAAGKTLLAHVHTSAAPGSPTSPPV